MKTHIIDALRPEAPAIDPSWEEETLRSILANRTDDVAPTLERPGRRRLVSVGLVAAAVVALVGGVLVARSSLPPDDVRPAGPVTKLQKIDPAAATKLELGDTLEIVADLPHSYDGDPLFFRAFAGDGVVVGSVTPEESEAVQGRITTQSHPVMYDANTMTLTLLDDRNRPEPTWVGDVVGNETAVVWVEGSDTNIDTSDFTLYSYDRESEAVTVLGEFADPDGQIVWGNDLAIAGDTAYFSTPAYPAKRGQEAVYAVPVDGSEPPTVIAQGGEQVSVSGDTLTYRVRDPQNAKAYPTSVTYDLRTGESTPMPVSSHADERGFCGAEVTEAWETWCVRAVYHDVDPEQALLTIKETSGRTTEFAPFPVGSFNSPVPHDVIALGRWTGITVTTDDGQDREFLVDLDTKDITVFPDNTSFGSVSPDRSTVLVSSFPDENGPAQQRIMRIPGVD